MSPAKVSPKPVPAAMATSEISKRRRSSSRCSKKLIEPELSAASGLDGLGLVIRGGRHRALALNRLDLVFDGGTQLVRGPAEFGQAPTQTAAELGKLAWADKEQREEEDNEEFR